MKGHFTKETIWCRNRRKQRIYGEAYIPEGSGPFPLVIFSHGYGYNLSVIDEAALAENGIAVYKYDFCGGCPWSKSDGKSTDMSVMTEADDLEAVLDEMLLQDFVDRGKVFLSGLSQGAFVSIVVGERRQKDVQGMILYCPALFIKDFEKMELGGRKMPEKLRFSNMMISRRYVDDVKNYDVYRAMERFSKPVLYYQGDHDEMVPMRYAYESEKHFPNVKLTILPGAGHMLNYGFEDRLFTEMKHFVTRQKSQVRKERV